jgi:hypothetical protein
MGVGRTSAHPATHPRNTHDMTEKQPDTPVMETTIEGAQKRIASIIDNPNLALYGSRVDLEYIAVFLDSVGDEMAAMSTAYESLHDRYLNAIHAANDNA